MAVAQKGILICILLQFALFGSSFLVPPQIRTVIPVAILVVNVVSTVFVFMLAIKVYNVGLGVFLGLLTLFPCVGLIVLLVVNGKATGILRQNGYEVGLLGADLSAIPRD